jgi:hypothetical protein
MYPPIVARQRLGIYPPSVDRQRIGRNVTEVRNTHGTIEELLDTSFSMRSVSYQRKQAISSSQNFFLLYAFNAASSSDSYVDIYIIIINFQRTMRTKIAIPEISLNTWLLFLKVSYSRCDVPTSICRQTCCKQVLRSGPSHRADCIPDVPGASLPPLLTLWLRVLVIPLSRTTDNYLKQATTASNKSLPTSW